ILNVLAPHVQFLEGLLVNFRLGCFEDNKKDRALSGFAYEFKSDNSVEKCRSTCYRAGFIYFGKDGGSKVDVRGVSINLLCIQWPNKKLTWIEKFAENS
ncbi:hypothetical protein NECAME_18463, partial [Necator americanus]